MSVYESARYTGNQPAEWPMFYAAVEQSMPAGASFESRTVVDAERVYACADMLDGPTLERLHYYALGLSLCEFGQALELPDKQQTVVRRAADGVVFANCINHVVNG